MRIETRVVLASAVFVALITGIYWFTSYEDAGTTMLGLGAAAYAMLSGYLYLQARRLRRGPPRPEDEEEPKVFGPEEIGFFPAASVWPAAMGLGSVFIALGLVFGYWFIVIGLIVFVGAITGYATEAQVPH